MGGEKDRRAGRLLLVAIGLGALVACTEAADVDDTASDAPDLVGDYEAQVSGSEGCEAHPALVSGWMDGAFTIAGAPSALVFDFGDDVALDGSVDDAYGFDLGGAVNPDGVALSISVEGVVYSQQDRWVLEGDLEAVVDEGGSADCTMEAMFEAYQVAP